MSAPGYTVEIGNPTPASELGARALERLLGVDLRFEVDLFATGAGDLGRVRGLEAFRANLARSLVTPPGGIFWRPDYGVGITDFLNRRASEANVFELKNRIRSTVLKDPNVEQIGRLDVFLHASGLVEILLEVTVAGQADSIALNLRRR